MSCRLSVDLFFLGPSGQDDAHGVLQMLAVKSLESRMTCSRVVEWKGLVESTTRRLVADLDWLGLHRLVFKSHQEPAILALEHAVRESVLTVELVMGESPDKDYQSRRHH